MYKWRISNEIPSIRVNITYVKLVQPSYCRHFNLDIWKVWNYRNKLPQISSFAKHLLRITAAAFSILVTWFAMKQKVSSKHIVNSGDSSSKLRRLLQVFIVLIKFLTIYPVRENEPLNLNVRSWGLTRVVGKRGKSPGAESLGVDKSLWGAPNNGGGRRKVPTMSKVLSSVQYICFGKFIGSNMVVPNLLFFACAI